jgi:hypothetical protein
MYLDVVHGHATWWIAPLGYISSAPLKYLLSYGSLINGLPRFCGPPGRINSDVVPASLSHGYSENGQEARTSQRLFMRSPRERTRRVVLLLNSVDRLGRTVEPSVLSVAQDIVSQAVSHGEKLLGDPALALTLFEEAAATVSKTAGEKLASGKPGIRDIRRYLFRVYLRRIGVEKKASLSFDQGTAAQSERHAQQTDQRDIDRHILLTEVLESCDTLTREIIYLRLEGCSWKEIEKRSGIPLNAASLRFSKTLRRLRNQFWRCDI